MKKFCFLQDWGTYSNQTFVVVGMTLKEIIAAMRRRNFKKSAILSFEKGGRPKSDEDAAAFVWVDGGMSLLWFPEWKLDITHYSDLVHETNHLVFEIARDKGMSEEAEAQAYLQEYLWNSLIYRLNKFSCVKSKRSKRVR